MDKIKLKNLPKIDLHCHLDGSVSQNILEELLGKSLTKRELSVDNECKSLKEYLEKFDLPLSCMNNEENLYYIAREFVKELKKDNIIYAEVRFAPMLSVNENLKADRIMDAVIRGLKEGSTQTGITCNLIACLMRHHDNKTNLRLIDELKPFVGKGLAALDLAGNEAAFPMYNFREVFTKAQKEGFDFTIHAGECYNADNIKESIELGAKRLGHGIALSKHEELKHICREKNIVLEMCPISNMQTKAVKDMKDYPLREFLDAGLKVTINTDNRTVSDTSILKEFEFITENYGIDFEDIKLMSMNAINGIFDDEEVKEKLRGEFLSRG